MGLRFRKSVKVAPGVKLNLNKKSTSVTFGGKGAHYTVSSSQLARLAGYNEMIMEFKNVSFLYKGIS